MPCFYVSAFQLKWIGSVQQAGGKDPLQDRRKDRPEVAGGTDNLEKEMEAWVGAFKQEAGVEDASPEQRRSALPQDEESLDSSENQGSSNVPYPVLAFDPNVDGIRGLTRNVSEWGVRLALSPNGQPQFIVLGGVRGTVVQGSTPFPGIAQDPSMAFEDVGFRCVMAIDEKQN